MCGITGYIDFTGDIPESVLPQMMEAVVHRGPDDSGKKYFQTGEASIGLGFKRLSIIDLSEKGHQPMSFEDLWIIFNGEIYNYEEVKKELAKEGYNFVSTSDTEVVLKAYHRWGIDCLHKFRGMWGFALWDNKEHKLMICRDRVGVKPLYWYWDNKHFIFGSELFSFRKHPGFKKNINHEALALYLQYGYITSPYSIFENTQKLDPGSCLTIDMNGDIKEQKYWRASDYFNAGLEEHDEWMQKDETEVLDELESVLQESFNYRMVSDVPVGIFLSGGIDSSLVTALIQKQHNKPIKTFTIGFNEKAYNEAGWAKKVAEHIGTEHVELFCTPKDALEVIPKLPDIYDEPFGDSSAIPTFLVSQLAVNNGVKVSLSADGGDELFCGYTRYQNTYKMYRRFQKLPAVKLLGSAVGMLSNDLLYPIVKKASSVLPNMQYDLNKDRLLKLKNFMQADTYIEKYDLIYNFYQKEELKKLGLKNIITQTSKFSNGIGKLEPLSQAMLYDINTYMIDDILVKVDRATMANSLEGREPFLDHHILELACRLPSKLKIKNGESKYLLKQLLYRQIPRKLVDRPKMGFSVPIYEWFTNELKDYYYDYLNADTLKKDGLFNSTYVDGMMKDFMGGKGIYPFKLWFLFAFQIWKEKFFAD